MIDSAGFYFRELLSSMRLCFMLSCVVMHVTFSGEVTRKCVDVKSVSCISRRHINLVIMSIVFMCALSVVSVFLDGGKRTSPGV